MGTLYPGRDPPAPASTAPDGAKILGARDDGGGPGPYVMSCETLVGDAIVNKANESLGSLAHVMIEVPGGRIAYAVLARGGVLGIGEKLHAIPWQALSLDAERRCFVLDIERERLDEAPGFDRARWPSMADPSWERSVRGLFGPRVR
jgi:hypothetical protein